STAVWPVLAEARLAAAAHCWGHGCAFVGAVRVVAWPDTPADETTPDARNHLHDQYCAEQHRRILSRDAHGFRMGVWSRFVRIGGRMARHDKPGARLH